MATTEQQKTKHKQPWFRKIPGWLIAFLIPFLTVGILMSWAAHRNGERGMYQIISFRGPEARVTFSDLFNLYFGDVEIGLVAGAIAGAIAGLIVLTVYFIIRQVVKACQKRQ